MYGRDDDGWADLVAAASDFLDEVAVRGALTNYSDLNAELVERTGHRAFNFADPAERAAIGHLLGHVVVEDYPSRGYKLSALVIYLHGNDPSTGFYILARQMGLMPATGGDKDAFWAAQTRGLFGS
ncbi:hypothetical protein [Oerskovia flava]|uniref:hypothetical protein n=1 Tax=Oerskovia flava TaxID=2986422 RepID=UPI00223FAACC|nr:hypothetical protein [Oerskovia sp. JB1-3-2]